MMNTAKKLHRVRKFKRAQHKTRCIFHIPVWFLDTAVEHFKENAWVVGEVYHELLGLLQCAECVLVEAVSVVEKQVVLARDLDLNLLRVLLVALILFSTVFLTRRRILTLIASSVPTSCGPALAS